MSRRSRRARLLRRLDRRVAGAFSQELGHRADVDALRSLAVLGVVVFDLSLGGLRAGFAGFDVLFVVGGFLLTRSIGAEVLRTGSFCFSRFYARRARRLLPALYFTLASTFALAYALFSPADLQRLGGVVVHALVGVSNVFFWTEGSYAEALSRFEPLLPTWAVSVALQLVLVWPALLVLLLRRTPRFTVPLSVAALGAASFLLSLALADGRWALLTATSPRGASWLSDGPATLFYLTPFRLFEFAIGACLAWTAGRGPGSRLVREPLAAAGLVLIGTATFVYAGPPPFPPLVALLPCLGTALFLQAGTGLLTRRGPGSWLAKLGRVGYPLYLVHWPIAVFLRYETKFEPNVAVGAIVFGVSLALAAIVHRLVERPVREGAGGPGSWTPGAVGFACALCALAIAFPSASSWANRGWPWRFGQHVAVQALGDVDALSRERRQYLNRYAASYFLHPDKTRNLLVVGDGLADDLFIALSQTLDQRFEIQPERYLARCGDVFTDRSEADDECKEILASLDFSLKVRSADEIYLAFDSPDLGPGTYAPLIGFLRERAKPGVRFVLFGRGPRFPKLQAAAARMLGEGASEEEVERTARRLPEASPDVDRRMKATADALGIEFVSRYDILCDDDRCRFFTKNDSLMFVDPTRLTLGGARWYGSRVAVRLFGKEVLRPREAPRVADPKALMEAYTALLAVVDGKTVFDVKRLPEAKEVVRSVLMNALRRSSEREQQEKLETGVKALAFFQPGVGEKAVPIDAARPGGGTWRQVVEADIKGLVEGLVAAGYTP